MEILLVVVLVAALLGIALPNLHSTRLRNNEAAAVKALQEVVAAQEQIRRAALIDGNADGSGEFAFLQEISGERNPRTFTTSGGKGAGSGGGPPAPLPQFRHKVQENGDAEVCGYRFRLYLPGPGGKAVGETRAGPAAEPDPALSGSVWCIYAWPVRLAGSGPVTTGTRSFFANQSGEVLAADARYAALAGGEGHPAADPAAGAAFQVPGPLDTITGAAAVGTLGRDGNTWRVVK